MYFSYYKMLEIQNKHTLKEKNIETSAGIGQ